MKIYFSVNIPSYFFINTLKSLTPKSNFGNIITTILVWWDNGEGIVARQNITDHHSDLVAGENADAVSAQYIPKPDGAIR